MAHVENERFSDAIHRFLASLDSVAELSAFATEHVPGLDRDEATFVALASVRFPNAPKGQHAAAGELIRQAVTELREQVPLAESEGDSSVTEVARTVGRSDVLVELQKNLEDLTGDRFSYYLYNQVWREALQRPARLPMMRASLLTTAIGEFENLIASLVREFLRQRPEILKSDDVKYSLSEIEGFATLDDFLAYGREKYADSLMRGGFDDWMEWFDKRHKIPLASVTDDVGSLRELFQRRHLIVHNGGIVNKSYLSKLADGSSQPKLGQMLKASDTYLANALDELSLTGICLGAVLMWRTLPVEGESHPADSLVTDQSFRYLVQGRYSLVERLTSATIALSKTDTFKMTLQVNCWLSRKRMNGLESVRDAVSAWPTATLSSRYRLAKLALLDQVEEAYDLGVRLLESGEFRREDWRDWPLLAEVRAYEESIAGEPALASDAIGKEILENALSRAGDEESPGDEAAAEPRS